MIFFPNVFIALTSRSLKQGAGDKFVPYLPECESPEIHVSGDVFGLMRRRFRFNVFLYGRNEMDAVREYQLPPIFPLTRVSKLFQDRNPELRNVFTPFANAGRMRFDLPRDSVAVHVSRRY